MRTRGALLIFFSRVARRRGSQSRWAPAYDPNAERKRRKNSTPSQLGLQGSPALQPRATLPRLEPVLPSPAGSPMLPCAVAPVSRSPRESPPVMASQASAQARAREQVMEANALLANERARIAEEALTRSRTRETALTGELERMKRDRRAGSSSARSTMGARPRLHPLLLRTLSARHVEPLASVTVGDVASAPLLHQDSQYGRPGSTLLGRPAFRFNPPPLPPVPSTRRPSGVPADTAGIAAPAAPVVSNALADVLQARTIRVNLTTRDQAMRVGHIAVQSGIQSQPVTGVLAPSVPRVDVTDGVRRAAPRPLCLVSGAVPPPCCNSAPVSVNVGFFYIALLTVQSVLCDTRRVKVAVAGIASPGRRNRHVAASGGLYAGRLYAV